MPQALVSRHVIDPYPLRANLFHLSLHPHPTELFVRTEEIDGERRERISFVETPGSHSAEPKVKLIRQALQDYILKGAEASGLRVKGERPPIIIDTSVDLAPSGSFNSNIPILSDSDSKRQQEILLCLHHKIRIRSKISLDNMIRKDASVLRIRTPHPAYRGIR